IFPPIFIPNCSPCRHSETSLTCIRSMPARFGAISLVVIVRSWEMLACIQTGHGAVDHVLLVTMVNSVIKGLVNEPNLGRRKSKSPNALSLGFIR
ncbi:4685_t:CDS:2, partial [Racocetra persica]